MVVSRRSGKETIVNLSTEWGEDACNKCFEIVGGIQSVNWHKVEFLRQADGGECFSDEELQELLTLEQSHSENGRGHVWKYEAWQNMFNLFVAADKADESDARVSEDSTRVIKTAMGQNVCQQHPESDQSGPMIISL